MKRIKEKGGIGDCIESADKVNARVLSTSPSFPIARLRDFSFPSFYSKFFNLHRFDFPCQMPRLRAQ